MHNLIGNAIKFTTKGTITVDAKLTSFNSPDKDKEAIGSAKTVRDKMDINFVQITIADTGIGIGKEKHEEIFSSFEQIESSLSREHGGTGLGLAITRRLVELHGGSIWLESEINMGSKFIFTIPVANKDQREKGVSRSDSVSTIKYIGTDDKAEQSRRISMAGTTFEEDEREGLLDRREPEIIEGLDESLSVLIVDDDPINLQVLENILSVQKIQIKQASDGYQALEIIDQTNKLDLVLLDIMMPKINGYQVCEKLREKYTEAKLPVIMLTAKNQVSDLVQALNSGANDYLTKPFSKNELLARMKMHIKLSKYFKAEKFTTVGQMAAGIIHDLKNPIAAIIGYAELVAMDELNPVQKEYLEIIGSEANRLTDMAHEILEFVKGETKLDLEEVNAHDYVAEIVKFLTPSFKAENINLISNIQYKEKIKLDQDRFRRVIYNIANNAKEAIGSLGNFVIEVAPDPKDNKMILFTFSDNAGGIPEEIQATLFEPFVTHGKSNGTGLGMAMVKKIVEEHGGKINFDTKIGEGTKFYITLPL